MATETLKSTVVTNLDATPPVRATGGAGSWAYLAEADAYVTPTNGVTTGSLYRMVRLPTTAIVKKVEVQHCNISGATLTTFTADVTLYYSDQTLDMVGAGQGNSGLVNSLNGSASLFANAHAFAGDTAGAFVDVTDSAGNYPASLVNQPLWQAAGLSQDPGGFFDLVFLTDGATNSLTGTVQVAARVQFAMPYAS